MNTASVDLAAERRSIAEEQGSFMVKLLPSPLMGTETNQALAVHETVLRPLLRQATECRVYGLPSSSELRQLISPIVRRAQRSYVVLDTTKELIAGYERLWNSGCRRRGTALLAIEFPMKYGEEILSHCSIPQVLSSRSQLKKAHTSAAIAAAIKIAKGSGIVVCFPANNGIEWVDLFARRDQLLKLFDIAQAVGGEARAFGLLY